MLIALLDFSLLQPCPAQLSQPATWEPAHTEGRSSRSPQSSTAISRTPTEAAAFAPGRAGESTAAAGRSSNGYVGALRLSGESNTGNRSEDGGDGGGHVGFASVETEADIHGESNEVRYRACEP